ncbi:MAG: hypothetical protein JXA33_15475 [Anaerolineae bacterium]|nr:hypothetical protein [Anaerolineae bacterium]
MITKTIPSSPDLPTARAQFMACLREWIESCVDKYAVTSPTDVHDQCTYTTGWEPYLRATRDLRVLAFLKRQRDEVREHFIQSGQWRHGYWKLQEAHHGTEHFGIFLATLFRLDPQDRATQQQLLDVTEHIGNWVPGIPAWFSEETGLFRSMYMGTGEVREEPGMALNIPDHLRYIDLCLHAHSILKTETRYLYFASRYANKWADAILAAQTLPVGLLPSGPVYDLEGDAATVYRGFVGMVGHLDNNVDRAENLLASGGIDIFLTLWRLTGDTRFRRTCIRLLDILATQLDDPDAGAAAAAIRDYRRLTGDTRYDDLIIDTVATLHPFAITELGIEPEVRRPTRPRGIGKRIDAPNWFEDGVPRLHNPILLATAAEIQENEALLIRAVDIAHTYFALARETLSDGRHHGCAANTISAIARGHGRENHAGMVTAVLGALEMEG